MCDIFLTLLFMVKFPCHISIKKYMAYVAFIKICIPKFVKDALKPPNKMGYPHNILLISP